MKLSKQLSTSAYLAVRAWASEVRTLEADLADANARAMELTARCDRMRVAATEANDSAREWKRSCDMATATLHLIYEMREHALRREWQRALSVSDYERDMAISVAGRALAKSDRGVSRDLFYAGMAVVHFFDLARIKEQDRQIFGRWLTIEEARLAGEMSIYGRYTPKLRAFHRRAQAAESRAIKAEREAATLRVRLQGAIAKIPPGDLWRMRIERENEARACATPGTREVRRNGGNACDMDAGPCACGAWHKPGQEWAGIPDVALEATSGGNRQAEAAECVAALTKLGARATIDGPSTLRPGDTLVTGGIPVGIRGPFPIADTISRVDSLRLERDAARARAERDGCDNSTTDDSDLCDGCAMFPGPPPVDVDALRRTTREIIQAKTDAIAERDARIATLERERDEARDTQRDLHRRTQEAEALAESRAAMARACCGACDYAKGIARAERAEAAMKRVRDVVYDMTLPSTDAWRAVHAIIDGKEVASKPSEDRCPHCFGGWDDPVCGGMECTKCGGSGKRGGRNA